MCNFKIFMSRRALFLLFFLSVYTGFSNSGAAQSKTIIKAAAPGETNYNPAKPWVFWYWMEASVSSAGIRADLIAMKEQGFAGAYLMCIKGKPDDLVVAPPVIQLSPIWWAKIREAFQIADSLGLKLAMHVGDGFATAGGPWITPAMSMQRVIWSDTTLNGGRDLDFKLPKPTGIREDYYKDIAVYAFPALSGSGLTSATVKPVVTTNAAGQDASILIDPGNTANFSSKKPCWIDYGFEKPFSCRTIQIRTKGVTFQAKRLSLWVSQDGKNYTFYQQLKPARSGWQDYTYPVSYSIPEVKAKHFRFVFDPEGTEPGSEDLDDAKWSPSLMLTG
ncbi:MAG: glycosyl hydrolase, partial [Sphingobacterium sp.]